MNNSSPAPPSPAGTEPRTLLWSGLGLMLTLLVCAGLAIGLLWRNARGVAEEDVRRVVNLLAQHTALVVDPVDRALSELQQTLEAEGFAQGRMDATRLHELARQRAAVGRQLRRIAIVDAQRRIVAVSDKPDLKPGLVVDDPWFAPLARGALPVTAVHRPRDSRVDEARVVPLVRTLHAREDGAFLGGVVAALSTTELRAFHSSLNLGADWQVEMLRTDGLALTGGVARVDWSAIARDLPAGQDGALRWLQTEDGEVIVALRRVGDWPLLAAVAVRADALATPWKRQGLVMAALSGAGAASLLGLVGMGVAGARRTGRLTHSLGLTEGRYRALVESSPDGIVVARQGRVEYANPAMSHMLGAGQDQPLAGRNLNELLDDLPEPARSGERATRLEHRLHTLSGPDRPVETLVVGSQWRGDAAVQLVLRDITERQRQEQQLAATRREVESLAMAAEVARESEKRRIARELHDELGQVLTVQQFELELLAAEAAAHWPESRQRLQTVQSRTEQALAVTRRISGDLRPLVLDDLGLVAALEWLVDQVGARAGLQGKLHIQGEPDLITDPVATTVFRIAQECLTNVMRHADARQVHLALRAEAGTATPGSVELVVSDDGRGIDRSVRRRGLGLRGIAERVRLLGGEVHIGEAPGGGTRVEVKLPLAPAPAPGPDDPTERGPLGMGEAR